MTPAKFLIFFTVFLTTQSFAKDLKDESWARLEQMRVEEKVSFDMPEFLLSHGLFFRADRVCLSGENQNRLEPIKFKSKMICVKKEGDDCVKEIKVHPSKKVSGHRYGCIEWKDKNPKLGCLHWGTMPYKVQTIFTIDLVRLEGEVAYPEGKKVFKVATCKDIE